MVTTTLLTGGRTAPRTVVGSVGASEFLVTLAASAGFLTGLGTAGISLGIVLTLLAGGLVAAPISAWLVSRLPGAVLGTAVGGLILSLAPKLPVSVFVTTISFVIYVICRQIGARREHTTRRAIAAMIPALSWSRTAMMNGKPWRAV